MNRFARHLSFGSRRPPIAAAILAIAGPLVVGLMDAPRCSAQSGAGAAKAPAERPGSPSFEVASIKLAQAQPGPGYISGNMTGPGTPRPGQPSYTGWSLKQLLTQAFNLRDDRLAGPRWLDEDKFDIVAKAPAGSTKEQVNQMLQNLLVERFGLVFHWEDRELPTYEMQVGKSGLKMKEVTPPPDAAPFANGPPSLVTDKDGLRQLAPGSHGIVLIGLRELGMQRVSARAQSVAALVPLLQLLLKRSVVDKTGLTGTYDFNLDYAVDSPRPAGSGLAAATEPPTGQAIPPDSGGGGGPTLMNALESQLGLKLESKKGPVEVLVVDSMNRKPTEN